MDSRLLTSGMTEGEVIPATVTAAAVTAATATVVTATAAIDVTVPSRRKTSAARR